MFTQKRSTARADAGSTEALIFKTEDGERKEETRKQNWQEKTKKHTYIKRERGTEKERDLETKIDSPRPRAIKSTERDRRKSERLWEENE